MYLLKKEVYYSGINYKPELTMTSPNGIYATRASRAWCDLSDQTFDVLNKEGSDALALVGYGCLDAPQQIPAGSVKSYGTNFTMVLPSIIQRTEADYEELARREEIAKRLIDEILAEEQQ